MKFLGFDRVLCLSPHPDDVEYSMSGTIYKHQDTHFDVVLLSYGTTSDKSTGQWRENEIVSFWGSLRLLNVRTSTLKTSGNFDTLLDSGWIDLLEKQYTNKHNYDAIIGPSSEDSHYEHQITNRIMQSLSRNKPLSILEYRSPSILHSWSPNLFVSLEHFYKLKCDALRNSFKSQIDSLYFSEECIKAFHEDYPIKKRGINSVEQFKIKILFK